MKKIIISLSILVLSTMSTVAIAGTLPRPEALSEETINISENLSQNYDTLVIKDFTADRVEYSRVDDEEKVKINQMLPLLKSNITLTLEGELKSKGIFKNILRNNDSTSRTVVLEGQFSEFNAGSKALKFFVGFGAGKAYIKFKGRLVDAANGKELATFEDRETGYRGAMSLEGYQDLFPHQAKGIGENLAKFLSKLY